MMNNNNYAVLFLDLQEEIVKNSRTISVERLTATSTALAKLAALHGLPAFASAVPPGGAYFKDVLDALPKLTPRNRTQTSAYTDSELFASIKTSGAKTLILSGCASEIVVQRTALDALGAGYHIALAVDAIGGIDHRTEHAAFSRLGAHANVTMTSVITLAAELAGDFTTELGGATLGIAYAAIGAASR